MHKEQKEYYENGNLEFEGFIDVAKIENQSFIKLIEEFINDLNVKKLYDYKWEDFIQWIDDRSSSNYWESFNLRGNYHSQYDLQYGLFKIEKLLESEKPVSEDIKKIDLEDLAFSSVGLDWEITLEFLD